MSARADRAPDDLLGRRPCRRRRRAGTVEARLVAVAVRGVDEVDAEIERAPDQPPAVLAIGWLVSRPGISAALIGPETIAELEANAAAGAVDLAPDLLERVDAIRQAD